MRAYHGLGMLTRAGDWGSETRSAPANGLLSQVINIYNDDCSSRRSCGEFTLQQRFVQPGYCDTSLSTVQQWREKRL
jgi:hypothetical protein